MMRAAMARALAAALFGGAAAAAEIGVGPGGDLAGALARAAPGDVVTVEGRHAGPLLIDRPLTLRGGPAGALIDGGGRGSVVTVEAPDVTLGGLEIRNSGTSLPDMDSAVFLGKPAKRAVVEDNRLIGNLVGVYVWGAGEALVRRNLIHGRRDLRMSERGDAVTVWNAPGAEIVDNEVRYGRDGVLAVTSRDNRFVGNTFRDLRFAIHYMYTNSSEIAGNRSIGNDVGFALMFSSKLMVTGNLSQGDRQHGFALNYANGSEFTGNVVRDGGDKCVFIYNSNKNDFRGNLFSGCEIGVHFTAGSEGNRMRENGFMDNRTQVKYVGTRLLDWSDGGRGNFWSDNPAFDLDGDGIADMPYRPNDLVDRVVWAVPLAKLLLNSPAVQVVRWAQSQFPALYPGGVVDSAPLMRPPPLPAPVRETADVRG